VSGPRKRIQTAHTGAGEIVLRQRTGAAGDLHYEVIVNGAFLFSTYNRVSERALARLAIEGNLHRDDSLSVLIGGLGTGYTLQAALEYDKVRQVTVVERESTVVDWARTYFSSYNENALDDPRVSIVVEDFLAFLSSSNCTFDAVCIDLDNGPHWTAWEGNSKLYEEQGIEELRQLLAPSGCLTVWSSGRSEALEKALSSVFGAFSLHLIRPVEMGVEIEYFVYRSPI